jgi:hypothetical protein
LPIHVSEAAYWTSGDRHAAGTQGGLTAIVIEGDGLEPSAQLRITR